MERLAILALVTEIVTEGIARVYARGTVYVALAVGIAVAALTGTGLLVEMGLTPALPAADWLLAGIALGGGASIIDRLKDWFSKR